MYILPSAAQKKQPIKIKIKNKSKTIKKHALLLQLESGLFFIQFPFNNVLFAF